MEISNPWKIFFPKPLWLFYGGLYKKVISIQSWELEIFSVEVLHYFRLRYHDQRIRGPALEKMLCFQPLPPPLPYHLTEVLQQLRTPSSLPTEYIGKGVDESQFARQGRMVSGGVPRGSWRFYICQVVDSFYQRIG